MSWWNDAIGYEVYIRSFADSDGDGIGDFRGLMGKLDHLAWLGIDVVWVTPFYPSPQADFGYDVADYIGVDPVYGTMTDFDAFVSRADELGLKVMIDLVPNHSSSEHEWFRSALADPGAPHRDYYLFERPGPDGLAPNNWVSNFGGPAWTLDADSGEYYCHLFLPEQPDLNWASEAVRAEFDGILSFWKERGVDGVRIDVAHALMKHPSMASNPQPRTPPADASPAKIFASYDHLYDQGQESTKDIYRRWKGLDGFSDIALVGEVYVDEVEASASYMGVGGIDLSLFFGLNRRPWDPVAFVEELHEWVAASPTGFAWTIASHDEHRPPTRFGGGDVGRRRALSLWTGIAMLPGMPFVYQGEELGLEDGYVAPEDVQDPVGHESYDEGRDPCRTPMPWTIAGPHRGFTTGTPWLTAAPRREDETVEHQRNDPASFLHGFRSLIAARRRTQAARRGPVEWLESRPGVLAFRRGETVTIANLTDAETTVTLPDGDWTVGFSTNGAVEVGSLQGGSAQILELTDQPAAESTQPDHHR